jgi:rhamnulokinase
LVDLAEEAEPLTAVFNPNDPIFLHPGDHPQHIRDCCQQTGQPVPQTPGAIVRCVLESLALAYREVLELVTAVAHKPVSVLHIVGGGTQNHLLNQLTADATGLPVVTGPIEATVIGNALVQLITLGEIADLAQARQIVAEMDELKRYEPEGTAGSPTAVWDNAYGHYQRMVQSSRLDHSANTL